MSVLFFRTLTKGWSLSMTSDLVFFNNIRFQLAGAAILLIIIIDYIKNPHLKLMSTKCFQMSLICTSFNLFLDVAAVYALTHTDTVSPLLCRTIHQLFILSMIAVLLFNFMYIFILSRRQKRLNARQYLIVSLPMALSVLEIAAGRVEYHISDTFVYSDGPMINAAFICGFVYLVFSFTVVFGKHCPLSNYNKACIRIGMVIWVIVMIVQLANRALLLSGLGSSLMLMCVYFSFENQKENYDSETQCFNKNAFHRQMNEYYQSRKPMTIVNIYFQNYERVNSIFGHDFAQAALLKLENTIEKYLTKDVFHSRSNMFTVFFTGTEPDCDKLIKIKRAAETGDIKEAALVCRINIIDLQMYANNTDEAHELIGYMREYSNSSDETVCRLNSDVIEKMHRRSKIDKLLSDAVKNNGFEMVYQPIFCPEEGKFKSAEALIRLKSTADLGFVSPEEFIPIAEEKGLIMDIGDIALRLVADFSKRSGLEKKLEYIEVNLSGIQACSPDLESRLTKITDECGIDPSFINLEITETAALNSIDSFLKNVFALRRSGFSFSMDDFGTGYSNLSQMNRMHYDLIKIDKSIIWDAFGKGNDSAERLLSSVISLLNAINVKIVAEGVETKEMADYLTEKGVDYLQGYYFSRPVSEEKFLDIISESRLKTV